MVTTTLKLRADLQSAEVVDADGVLYYDVTDPRTGGVLRLFDYEWLIAQKLDGQRGFDELARWTEELTERAAAYLSLMRGGIGSDPVIAGILDRVRGHFVEMIVKDLPPHPRPRALRVLLRGWVGFVEVTSLAWLESPAGTISKAHLIDSASSVLVLLLGDLIPTGA